MKNKNTKKAHKLEGAWIKQNTFSKDDSELLREFWEIHCEEESKQKQYSSKFLAEMSYFMERIPELQHGTNKKSETVEGEVYLEIAKLCQPVLKKLITIDSLERAEILSFRDEHPRREGKIVPVADPYEYVKFMMENAKDYGLQLKKVKKYWRQLWELEKFIASHFPHLREIKDNDFLVLAHLLWPGASFDSLEKAHRQAKNYRKKASKIDDVSSSLYL